MNSPVSRFDFRYAVANTEILVAPRGLLETFGNTILEYTLVTEPMDEVGRSIVRTGRMQLLKPQIVTPSNYSRMFLEGFGIEARRYADWLEKNEKSLRILQYGYTLKRESFSEERVGRPIDDVCADVKAEAEKKNDPYLAVVKGVEQPWDVCLVRLFWDVVTRSAPSNIRELAAQHMFDGGAPVSPDVRAEIERAFAAAAKDPSLRNDLGRLLKKHGVFDFYEDRFYSLYS